MFFYILYLLPEGPCSPRSPFSPLFPIRPSAPGSPGTPSGPWVPGRPTKHNYFTFKTPTPEYLCRYNNNIMLTLILNILYVHIILTIRSRKSSFTRFTLPPIITNKSWVTLFSFGSAKSKSSRAPRWP